MFIKKEDLTEVRRRLKRHEQFRALCTELVQAFVALTRKNGFNGRTS